MASRIARLLRRPVWFVATAALAVVALRIAAWDWRFFALDSVPNHDLYQDAHLFATSMHSMRITGDIAWWNPLSGGYAQYYLGFFFPVAPTAGNVVFFVWAQAIGLLGLVGIAIPEYLQYVAVTYVVLPLLALSAVGAFAWVLFHHRGAVLLVLLAYGFSGIGIWHSAFLYWQEPATFFFLLAALIAALQRPSGRRFALLAVAVVVQTASLNYWTVYNLFFFVIVVCAYWWAHPDEVRRAVRFARGAFRRRRGAAVLATVVTGIALVGAGALALATVVEQAGEYERTEERYTTFTAFDQVQEARTFTTELFNPSFDRANEFYGKQETVQNARYIGAALAPLLLLFLVLRWGRRERFLLVVALGVLVVTFAPPVLLDLWAGIPFMDRIRHVFYFYSHYWQLAIVLLAAAALARLTSGPLEEPERSRAQRVSVGAAVLAILVLVGAGAFSAAFPVDHPGLQAAIVFGVITLAISVAVARMLDGWTRRAAAAVAVLVLLLTATDLTRYFWTVERADREYTAERWSTTVPLPEDVQDALAEPWVLDRDRANREAELFPLMPVQNQLWPGTSAIAHRWQLDAGKVSDAYQRAIIEGPYLRFYPSASIYGSSGDEPPPAEPGPEGELALADPPESELGRALENTGEQPVPPDPDATGSASDWSYNGVKLDVSAPSDGWLFIAQIADPAWEATVDGEETEIVRANVSGMAIPVAAGEHRVELSYEPAARKLYWPVVVILELTLIALLVLAATGWRRRPRGPVRT